MGPAVSRSRGCRHFGLELVAFRITRRYLSAIEAINLQSLAMAAPPNFYTNNSPSSIYKCADSTTSRYTFIKKSYIVWIVKASYSKKKKKSIYQRDFSFIHRLAATLFGIFWLEQISSSTEFQQSSVSMGREPGYRSGFMMENRSL